MPSQGPSQKVNELVQAYSLLSLLSDSRYHILGCHIQVFDIWAESYAEWEIRIWFHFSICNSPVWPAPLVEDTVFSSVYCWLCVGMLAFVWVQVHMHQSVSLCLCLAMFLIVLFNLFRSYVAKYFTVSAFQFYIYSWVRKSL